MQNSTENKLKKIISYYEDFNKIEGKFDNKHKKFEYKAPSSLHSGITTFGYGTIQAKEYVDIVNEGALEVKIIVTKRQLEERRFYLKVNLCLVEWKKYFNDIKIKINGKTFHEKEREFIENVHVGSPSLYFQVQESYLTEGENVVTIETKNGNKSGLYISTVDFVTLPKIEKYAQVSCRRYARAGEKYTVIFNAGKASVKEKSSSNAKVIKIERSKIFPEEVYITVVSNELGKASLELCFEDSVLVKATMPEIVCASNDKFIMGMESDDHRHDASEETNRLYNLFVNENFGNLIKLTPNYGRTFLDFESPEVWKERIDYFKINGIYTYSSDYQKRLPYLYDYAGEYYLGKGFSEVYLYFCPKVEQHEEIKEFTCFGDGLKAFTDYLKKKMAENTIPGQPRCIVSPSLLTVYESQLGTNFMSIEVVTNINILAGAIRGSYNGPWNACIATDWYFGSPNNHVKNNKVLAAMKYLYINGAWGLYIENALFKTNAFSREDWEDEYCATNRKNLREFNDYVTSHPRTGEIVVEQAVVYGNHEYFFWHSDDRIAEMPENGDWDQKLWGKWEDCSHHKCWRAIDAWLPLAENQNYEESAVNVKLFSGTPYGAVDVIPYEKDYSKYKSLAFLGWNTYEEALKEKLYNYVKEGGTLFISLCHLNKTDRNDKAMEYPQAESMQDLLGLTYGETFIPEGKLTFTDGKVIEITAPIKTAKCTLSGAEIVAQDSNGQGVIYRYEIGSGEIYFGAFAEYFSESWGVESAKHVLKKMGEKNASIKCDNQNISFVCREQENGVKEVQLLNMCTADDKAQEYTLTYRTNKGKVVRKGNLMPVEIEKQIFDGE